MRPLGRLKKRPEFLRVAGKGRKAVSAGVVLQALQRDPAADTVDDTVRFGLTASRKVGGAVQRNRAKRRLRAAARQLLSQQGLPGWDYVLIARASTVTRPWPSLVGDVEAALRRVGTSRRDGR